MTLWQVTNYTVCIFYKDSGQKQGESAPSARFPVARAPRIVAVYRDRRGPAWRVAILPRRQAFPVGVVRPVFVKKLGRQRGARGLFKPLPQGRGCRPRIRNACVLTTRMSDATAATTGSPGTGPRRTVERGRRSRVLERRGRRRLGLC